MRRVASLFLPNWPIDRLRRAGHIPTPPEADARASLEAIGPLAAAERALHCSVPKEGGWRPGARWARSEVAAAIEALPAHQRPSQRELGRTSVAAAHPFHGAQGDAPVRELSRRTEAAENPFGARARGHAADRPPFRPMPPDEVGAVAAHRAMPPLQFPGEDAPAKANRGAALRASAENRGKRDRYRNEAPSIARLAHLPPVQFPGEDMAARAAQRAPRRSSRDGHNGEAAYIAPPSLKQLAAMPAVQFPGEGPHPDNHGKSEPAAPTYGEGRFFQTSRTLGSVVARVCREEEGDAGPFVHPPAEPPLVTTHKVGSRVEVAAVNPAAGALGLHAGMVLTLARAQVPGLEMRPADPEGDRADLERLADRLARRWTPTVTIADSDSLFLDLSGVAHLHGGEERLARRLVRMLARHGIHARVGIADTAGAAWALARFGNAALVRRAATRTRGGPACGGNGQGAIGWADAPASDVALASGKGAIIAPPGMQGELLAGLPVQALRLDQRSLDLLARLGIDRIAQLAAMPRAPLVRRFGPALAMRLDQAMGSVAEPLDPVVPQEPIAVAERFAEPIATAEAIEHWLRLLVPRLCQALAEAGLGARAVELVADRVDGVPQRLSLGFARATRDPVHLLRLALRRIELIAPGFGIDAMTLHVRRADPLGATPMAPELAEEATPDLATLVDAIANRIGPARLWRVEARESDVPERSSARLPALAPPERASLALRLDDVRRLDQTDKRGSWPADWPRPVRLLRRPEPIDDVLALLPDQPPRRFTWRGRTHSVVRGDGPERIHGEWWRRASEALGVRDYYRVEDEEGARFWLFRRGDGERQATGDMSWYVHGLFG